MQFRTLWSKKYTHKALCSSAFEVVITLESELMTWIKNMVSHQSTKLVRMICKSQNKQNLKRRRNVREKEMEIQKIILMIPKPLMMINKKIQMTIIIRVNQELREAGFKIH